MGDPMVQNESQFVTQGATKEFKLKLDGGRKHGSVKITRVDSDHGSFMHVYQGMGNPEYPTAKQIEELKRASQLPEPEVRHLGAGGDISVSIPGKGVALLELT